uniref:Endonuclease-reverse transcriptase n=1 Tax=Plectus sambesii TaxID=2011161 RepID=A0A914W770_9BILA
MSVKRRYYQQCITPALLYGCESWALTKAAETRLAHCQRALERQFLGSRQWDKRSSDWLQQQTKLKDVITACRTRKWRHATRCSYEKAKYAGTPDSFAGLPLASAPVDVPAPDTQMTLEW